MSSEATPAYLPVEVDISKLVKNASAVKISPRLRKKFLEVFAITGNFSEASRQTGKNRQSWQWLVKNDERFGAAFREIKEIHADHAESCLLAVAMQPSREGFNDRKLLLQSWRPEIYGNKVEVKQNQTLNVNIEIPELNRILQQHNIAAATKREEIPDAEVIEILPNSHNKALAKR